MDRVESAHAQAEQFAIERVDVQHEGAWISIPRQRITSVTESPKAQSNALQQSKTIEINRQGADVLTERGKSLRTRLAQGKRRPNACFGCVCFGDSGCRL